jgi:hypothetical protein
MRGTLMARWLRAYRSDVWEQVERRTTGTADEDEDVLWHAHARIEAFAWERAHPVPAVKARAKRRVTACRRRLRKIWGRQLAG